METAKDAGSCVWLGVQGGVDALQAGNICARRFAKGDVAAALGHVCMIGFVYGENVDVSTAFSRCGSESLQDVGERYVTNYVQGAEQVYVTILEHGKGSFDPSRTPTQPPTNRHPGAPGNAPRGSSSRPPPPDQYLHGHVKVIGKFSLRPAERRDAEGVAVPEDLGHLPVVGRDERPWGVLRRAL